MKTDSFFKSSIGELVSNRKLQFSYYGPNDLATCRDISSMMDNHDCILEEIRGYHLTDHSVDSFYRFLILRKFYSMGQMTPLIVDEHKQRYLEIISVAASIQEARSDAFGIECLNAHPELILNGSKDVLKASLCLIDNNISSTSDELIANVVLHHIGHVLSNFKVYKKRVIDDKTLLALIISIDSYKKVKNFMFDNYCEVLSILYDSKSVGDETEFHAVLDRIHDHTMEECRNIIGGGIPIFHDIKIAYKLLKKVGFRDIGELSHILSLRKELELEWLKGEGHVIQVRSDPVGLFMKIVEAEGWPRAVVSMTHHRTSHGPRSCFDNEGCEPGLLDEFVRDENSGYLTEFRRMHIDLTIASNASIIETIAKSECGSALFRSFNDMAECLFQVYADRQLKDEISEIYSSVLECIKEDRGSLSRYGISMFVMGLIEKLLRTIVQIETPEKEYEKSLNSLLNNPVVMEVLGQDQSRAMQYYLTEYNEIGHDWRNRLAHWQDVKMDDINEQLLCSSLYLFNSVLMSVLLHLNRYMD